jgi:divalent metal cation (Fe/Co/Zn/Cd) transporter
MAAVVTISNGLRLLRPAIQDLMDCTPERPVTDQIEIVAKGVVGARSIKWVRVRKLGAEYFVDHTSELIRGCHSAMRTSSVARSKGEPARRLPAR